MENRSKMGNSKTYYMRTMQKGLKYKYIYMQIRKMNEQKKRGSHETRNKIKQKLIS